MPIDQTVKIMSLKRGACHVPYKLPIQVMVVESRGCLLTNAFVVNQKEEHGKEIDNGFLDFVRMKYIIHVHSFSIALMLFFCNLDHT